MLGGLERDIYLEHIREQETSQQRGSELHLEVMHDGEALVEESDHVGCDRSRLGALGHDCRDIDVRPPVGRAGS